MKFEFSQQISKNSQIIKFMKIRPVGVVFRRMDRQPLWS